MAATGGEIRISAKNNVLNRNIEMLHPTYGAGIKQGSKRP